MSLRLIGSPRYGAWTALLLAVGSACATSEEPDTDGTTAGRGSQGGETTAGATFGGSPAGGTGNEAGQAGAQGGSAPTAGSGSGGASAGTSSGGSASGGEDKGGSTSAGTGSGGKASGGSAGKAGGGAGGFGGSGGNGEEGGKGGSGATGGSAPTGCDWAGCMDKSCETVCPKNDSGYCLKSCEAIIDCVEKATSKTDCATEEDPMCVLRGKSTGTANQCTTQWESAGSGTLGPGRFAVEYFECACDVVTDY